MASLRHRNGIYYAQYYVGARQKRVSLRTSSLQIAKERIRQIESAQLRGEGNPLPTRTPIADIVTVYVEHIRQHKTPKSAQTDIYYLREMFGPICEALTVTSRRTTAKRRPSKPGTDRRVRAHTIEAPCFEQITTAQITEFIHAQVQTKGLASKTANRYREILNRLFNWAMGEDRVRLPGGINPAKKVQRYRERAPEIRFLTLAQIDEQLAALEDHRQLQAMVAMYIYAGLRREEALWLTADDVDLHASRHGMIRIRAKTIGEESWQPKTKVNRAVPISAALARYLLRYTPRKSDHGWCFPSPNGHRWDADNFSADLRAAQKAAGLQWACLDYRHTFGSQLAQKGVSLYKISTLMGNSPEICQRHYAALVPESLAGDIEFSPLPISHGSSQLAG
jgi:integrase